MRLFEPENESMDPPVEMETPGIEELLVPEPEFFNVMDIETEVEVEIDGSLTTTAPEKYLQEEVEIDGSLAVTAPEKDLQDADHVSDTDDVSTLSTPSPSVEEETTNGDVEMRDAGSQDTLETDYAVRMIENELYEGSEPPEEESGCIQRESVEVRSSEDVPCPETTSLAKDVEAPAEQAQNSEPRSELTATTEVVTTEEATAENGLPNGTSSSEKFEEIVIASDDEDSVKEPECTNGASEKGNTVEVIELSDSEDMPAPAPPPKTLPLTLPSILNKRKRPSVNVKASTRKFRVISSQVLSPTLGSSQAIGTLTPVSTQAPISLSQHMLVVRSATPSIVSSPAVQSPYVLVSTSQASPSQMQLSLQPPSILPKVPSSNDRLKHPRKVVLVQQNPSAGQIAIKKPSLTPQDFINLVMPTPDWNVNTYSSSGLYTISETILSQSGFEIIRKSITINSISWIMKFSVYGFEVNEFSVGTVATSVADIQLTLNRFSVVPVCAGLDLTAFKQKSFQKNFAMVQHWSTMQRHVDQNHRYHQCPLVIVADSDHPMEKKASSRKKYPLPPNLCSKCSNVKKILESRDPLTVLDSTATRSVQLNETVK